jgi:hypothetical protein
VSTGVGLFGAIGEWRSENDKMRMSDCESKYNTSLELELIGGYIYSHNLTHFRRASTSANKSNTHFLFPFFVIPRCHVIPMLLTWQIWR